MTAVASVYVEDVTAQLVTYTSLRWYRDTTPGGTFATLAATSTLVDGTTQYSITDASGSVTSIYRVKFYNTVSLASSGFGPAIYPDQFTMRRLRYEGARLARHASAGACTSVGTASTLIDTRLLNGGKDTFYHAGDYIYRPDAAAAGDFGVDPWTNAPASAEAYELYQLFPPAAMAGEELSWDDVIRIALRRLWVRDQVDLGIGDSIGTTRFSITAVAPFVHKLRIERVWFRSFDSNDLPVDRLFGKQGSYWRPVDNGADGVYLDLSSPPTTAS